MNTNQDQQYLEKLEHIDFTSYVKPRKTHLDPSVIQLRNFIFKCMKKYFERFGYKLEGHL